MTIALRGQAESQGAGGRFDAVLTDDGRFWWRIEGPLPEEVHFDGTVLRIRDQNGAVATPGGRELGLVRLQAQLLGAPWPEAGRPFEGSRISPGIARTDGNTAWSIETLQGTERVIGSDPVEAADRVVHRRVEHLAAGHLRTRIEVAEIERLGAEDLPGPPEPGGPMVVRFRDPGLAPLTIKPVLAGQLLVRVAWDGEPGWWILDTGASIAVLDLAAAERRRPFAVGESTVVSISGHAPARVYRLGSIDLGPVALEGMTATGMDLAPYSEAFGETIVGVIGFDLLARSVAVYEPERRGVLIGPPEAAPADVGWQPLVLVDRLPTVTGTIEDGLTGRFRLDTGATPALIANRWVASETAVLAGRESEPIDGGQIEARIGTIRRLELAGQVVTDVQTVFVTGGEGLTLAMFSDLDLIGNVGAPVLDRFRLVLDYGRQRIALEPAAGQPELPGSRS